MAYRLPCVLAVLGIAGCVTTLAPGTNLADATTAPAQISSSSSLPKQGEVQIALGVAKQLASQVSFDHRCSADRIRVIRLSEDALTVDLDVCGGVHRYKGFMSIAFWGNSQQEAVTWLDVTSLYPASTLPEPLPPQPPAASKPPAPQRPVPPPLPEG